MKVLLLADIADLGDAGDVVEVADGYARNKLIPERLAEPATDATVRAAVERREAARVAAERELQAMEALADRLDGYELTMRSRASPAGRLYGAVGVAEIAGALRTAGFPVEDGWVILTEPIKEVGEQTVRLELPHGLEAEVVVVVEAEQ